MRIIVLAGLLLLGGCTPRGTGAVRLGVNPRLEAIYGRSTLEQISQADRVEAFRLSQKPYPPSGVGFRIMDLLTEVGGPVEVDPGFAHELSALLTDDSSYWWDAVSGCMPQPGVKLRFVRESRSVDVYLCLRCGILWMSGGSVTSENWAIFLPISARLVAIVKQILPTGSDQFLH